MDKIAICNNIIAVNGTTKIDILEENKHTVIETVNTASAEEDNVSDIVISNDGMKIAIITTTSKKLIIYCLPINCCDIPISFILPRTPSKIRFTPDSTKVLVADKSGDVLIYDIVNKTNSGIKILGHLSLLLDVLLTDDNKYIITCDRDEKIRVSCYPHAYNIQTYCLGHKEFVNHIEILPHNKRHLISSSGDGTVKIWDYISGQLIHTVAVYKDVQDDEILSSFSNLMEHDGVEVGTLPIVHCVTTLLSEVSSLIGVTVYGLYKILFYRICTDNAKVNHTLENVLPLNKFPADIKLGDTTLYVLTNSAMVKEYKFNENLTFSFLKETKMFNGESSESNFNYDSIKILYKRKFDNVQEYFDRKKLRLQKK